MVRSYLTPKLREGESVDLSLYEPRQRTNIRLYGLSFKDYHPQMIRDYRMEWMESDTAAIVRIDTAKKHEAIKWCRTNLYHQDFARSIEEEQGPGSPTVTGEQSDNVTQHYSIAFKNPRDAMIFKLAFSG